MKSWWKALKEWRGKMHVNWREWVNPVPIVALLVLIFFGWHIIFGDQGLLTWSKLKLTYKGLNSQERHLITRLRYLKVEAERLDDPEYLEPLIRKELGYVKPNETVYQFEDVPPPTAAKAPTKASD